MNGTPPYSHPTATSFPFSSLCRLSPPPQRCQPAAPGGIGRRGNRRASRLWSKPAAGRQSRPQKGPDGPFGELRRALARLYEGKSRDAVWFQTGLLLFDLAAIVFFIANTFLHNRVALYAIEFEIGRASCRESVCQ